MLVRYCMKLASFRAGFRVVKPFTGAAICTSCVAMTRSCPGVLRCFKSTYRYPHHESTVRSLSTSFYSIAFRKANTGDNMDSHLTNTMNKYLAIDDEENISESLSLEEIARIQRSRLQASKKARGAREFFSKEPEKRKLSWDTIDQIRYLRQENPASEWSVPVLARSFNVSEEVVIKVLKSKFSPSGNVQRKQDGAAAENSGNGIANVRSGRTNALVESGGQYDQEARRKNRSQNYPQDLHRPANAADQTHMHSVREPGNLKESHSVKHQRTRQKNNEQIYQSQSQSSSEAQAFLQNGVEDDTDMEFTFGRLDFENVDSLKDQENVNPRVIKKGRNFFDESGEFLFRV